MEFRILGPLDVIAEGVPLNLGGPRQRALLAYLLIHAGAPVVRDQIIEDLWGDARPAQVENVLRVLVSRLRGALGPVEIVAAGGGYMLELGDGVLDARRFEQLAAEGQDALRAGDAEHAAGRLREALALWQGNALVDFAYEEFAQGERARLEELRLAALEARIEADLALGRHQELVPELEALVAEHPLRERLAAQLMLALYRSGRQGDALASYRKLRSTLVEELGLEPGPELRELEQRILRQDAALLDQADRVRLPAFATPLIGRRAELGELGALLADGARLVTLTGPGGIGKTRLAVQAAAEKAGRFPGGVHFVPLAPLRDPALVTGAIAEAIGVEEPGGELEAALARRLGEDAVLVVVDNFEHLDEAAPVLGSLLREAAGLRFLVTSRHPLRLYGEHEYPVPPLALEQEAVPLFVERAGARGRKVNGSDAVAAICRRLDCLPLAIELAAGRARELTPDEMLEQLPQRLELAAAGPRDVPARQQTLRGTIEWSYGLLSPEERRLLADLSVFAGGFDEDALQAVCGVDSEAVRSLADKSLVVESGTRFSLFETIREFGSEVLEESGRAADVFARHAEHYLARAEAEDSVLQAGGDTADALERLELDHDNLRAALDWAESTGGDLELRLAAALGRFWEWRGHVREGLERIDGALSRAAAPPLELRIRALVRAGVFAHMRDDMDGARARLEEALDHARASGDQAMVANTLRNLGALAKDAGDYERARALQEQALEISRESGDRSGISSSLINLADVALARGDAAAAEAFARESVDLASALGHDVRETMSLLNLGLAQLELDKQGEARAAFIRAIELCRRLAYREGAAVAFVGLAELAVRDRDPAAGACLLGAAEAQLDAAGAILESGELAVRNRTRKRLEESLDPSALEAAWAEGASLAFEQAVDAAASSASRGSVAETR